MIDGSVIVSEHFAKVEAAKERQKKWDLRFLKLAEEVGTWSKDPSTKVGAVITDGNTLVSVGYNGLPRGMKDDDRIKERDWKYKTIVHGEINAIHHANRRLDGCTLYTSPFMPCSVCASQVAQVGITRVVSYCSDEPRWADSFKITGEVFRECGVVVELYGEV